MIQNPETQYNSSLIKKAHARLVSSLRSLPFLRRKSRLSREQPIVVKDSFGKFLRQTAATAAALFVISSVAPTHLLETGYTADFFGDDSDFLDGGEEQALELPPFIMNEEGFVLKMTPVSEEADRIGLTDVVKHTVSSGDTLSTIAQLYGVSLKTIVWENNLNPDATLRIGQVVTIPPIDGVTHTVVAKTDTVSSIAQKYGVDEKLIREHNNLAGDTIQDGQKLFIPGGERKDAPRAIVRSGVRSPVRGGAATFIPKTVIGSQDEPLSGKDFIFPTIGQITQGFRPGHYAVDIANAAKPDVWAGAEGTISKIVTGCPSREVQVARSCGGGYGNYVIVNHGNGSQTLYAHLETVYVDQGQWVARGQALGKMGNTGRSYGATGRHVHVELYVNGQKRNFAKYL